MGSNPGSKKVGPHLQSPKLRNFGPHTCGGQNHPQIPGFASTPVRVVREHKHPSPIPSKRIEALIIPFVSPPWSSDDEMGTHAHGRSTSMSPRSLATLLVLVFAAGRASAATCADGSSPGSNGCCAATNECPPCCIYAAVSNYGHRSECRCLFCDGATAKIDAACTSPPPPAPSGCPAEYPTYAGGGIGANVCEYCYNLGTLTWEEEAAMVNGYLPRPPPPPPG